jgi:stress-induced morphogen
MVSFVYDVSQKQIEKDIKAGLTPEVLKLGKQAYKHARSKL